MGKKEVRLANSESGCKSFIHCFFLFSFAYLFTFFRSVLFVQFLSFSELAIAEKTSVSLERTEFIPASIAKL